MRVLLSLLLLFANGSLAVFAQSPSSPENPDKQVDSFVRKHNERRAKNPEGLLFTVRLKYNRKQFRPGEVITVELSFASSKPDTFTLDAATYDRSGRLHSDGFVLDRSENAVDPLSDYFNTGLHAFMSGGLRSIPVLTDKPHVMPVELNEWQRIEKPGHYRVYVVSNRVARKGDRHTLGDDAGSAVVSNVIEFDVLPEDKKWSTQKLNEVIAALAKPGDERRAACRTLRFLGTTAAATEMRKRFRDDDIQCEWEYKFGLIGSPHRDYVIRDMENAISLREQPVTSHFIRTLALLEFTRRVTASAPPYPAGNEEQIKQWQIEWDRRRSIFDELQLQYVRQLAMAIPQKQGQARATSLQTLLDQFEQNTSEFARWSTLLALLPEVFRQLPLKEQFRVLQYQWKPIASAAMLPVLREVLSYTYQPNSDGSENFHEFHQEDLRSTALRRLYELSPEEGRRLILEEIRRPNLRVNQKVLQRLPDETLPELNSVLISNFENARQKGSSEGDEISELIERYATDEILPRVQAVYDARGVGKFECRPQTALLAYFLRVAPSVGGEYLNKALAARGEGFTQCYKDLLNGVAMLHMSAEVEEVATAALDDEDALVVSQAAGVLAEYGSAEAETALWRRMEKWHEVNRSKETVEELGNDQVAIEAALREALTSGHAWLSDIEKLKRLRDLCLTGTRRKEVDEMIRGWNNRIYVTVKSFSDDAINFHIANSDHKSLDSLKAKLLQFPKGSVFKFNTAPRHFDEDQSEEIFQQIKNFLKDHGMNVEREPER
ncbi:MAG TPA: hypothetical protein VF290_04705 [Pyrinomonadaceae bacterium]